MFGAALFGAAVLGAPTSGAVSVGSGNFGGFEIDGDMQGASGADWSSAAVTAITDDSIDSGFQGSSRELRPSAWVCNTDGHNPSKADVQRVYVRPRADAGGQFLDVAWVRADPNGNVNISFEFNQQGTPGPAPTSGNCASTRTPGDLLVSYYFSGTSQNPEIQLFAWSSSGSAGDDGAWVDQDLTSAAAVAAVNAGTITDIGGGELAAGRFGEATINIGVALADSASCSTFGVVNVRSRSSNEMSAALQDRLPTTGADVSNCGSIRVEKDDDLDAPVAGADFEFSQAGSVVGSCTTDAAGVCEVEDLEPGAYLVRETSAPAGYVHDGTGVAVTVAAGETAVVPFTNFKVKYDVDITDGGENLVGTTRSFTVTARTDTGAGFGPLVGATPAVGLEPGSVGQVSANTCAAGTGLLGTCTVTVTSAVPGESTVEASLAGAEPASADNIWLDYRVQVTPATDEHPVDTEQMFTVALQIDRGTGFGPAANEDLDLDLDGAGSIVGSGGSCTTGGAGTCLVTVTSSAAGTSVVAATYHAEVNGTERDFSGVGQKTWLAEEEIETPLLDDPPTTTEPPAQDRPAQDPPADAPVPTPGNDVSSETAGEVAGRLEPPVTPPAASPVNLAELPRTGAGIREVILLALVMLLAGLSARVLGRRRPKTV